MKTLLFFKVFCFFCAGLTAVSLVTDLSQPDPSLTQTLVQAGMIMILTEFGFRSKIGTSAETVIAATETAAQKSNAYCYVFSKIGAGTIASSLLLQSLV